MNVANIGNTTGMQNYQYKKNNMINADKKFASYYNMQTPIKHYTLKMGGLVSRSLEDGGNVTVYKADDYTEENPLLRVVTASASGQEQEKIIDPRSVNPACATEDEMLALNAYLVETGVADNDIHTTIGIGAENRRDNSSYSHESTKLNYMSLVREMRDMQYLAGNRVGYAQYNKILSVYKDLI